MNVLVSPDSLKGALDQRRLAAAITVGLQRTMPDAKVTPCPLADGGEGTRDVVRAALGGDLRTIRVRDAYGRPRQAPVLVLPDHTWVLEAADGPGWVPERQRPRDAARATSVGLGDMLVAARDGGARRVWLGLGGTGSTDGGWGLLHAMGARSEASPEGLPTAPQIFDVPPYPIPLTCWCDVNVPAGGPRGAVYRFGPQKGVAPADLPVLAERMDVLGQCLEQVVGRPLRTLAGAGAAGGAGMALAALGGVLTPGAEAIAQLVQLESQLTWADLVITGEGRLDASSLDGKVVGTVLAHARVANTPVVALVGEFGDRDAMDAVYRAGLAAAFPLTLGPTSRSMAMRDSARAAEEAAAHLGRWLAMGRDRPHERGSL
ncbi:MAG: glycerate kinase [Thermaerobacter sp.]|nr:glycerate kinase [Thermaerobacter sp.]